MLARKCDTAALERALDAGADPEAVAVLTEADPLGRAGLTVEATCLVAAAFGGCEETVRSLLARGADVGARCRLTGITALIAASHAGAAAAVEALADGGADLEARDAEECTALHHAAGAGSVGCVLALAARGADGNATAGRRSVTPLHVAAERGQSRAVRALVLRAGSDCGRNTGEGPGRAWRGPQQGSSAVHLAASAADAESIEFLLRVWPRPDRTRSDGCTALHVAAQVGCLEAVEALLRAGARVDARSETKETPLMLASLGGHAAVVRELCRAGAAVGARPGDVTLADRLRTQIMAGEWRQDDTRAVRWRSPLHLAGMCGEPGVVSVLVAAGAPVDGPCHTGEPPLVAVASQPGACPGAAELLRCGADVRATTIEGATAVHVAAMHGDEAMLLLFLGHGLTVEEEVPPMLWRPVHFAACVLRVDQWELLLRLGADPEARDARGRTPLDLFAAAEEEARGRTGTAAAARAAWRWARRGRLVVWRAA